MSNVYRFRHITQRADVVIINPTESVALAYAIARQRCGDVQGPLTISED